MMQNSRGHSQAVLLSVLAHPDDESFGMGGTLALYAKRGAAVYLACATRGELGDVTPDCLEGFGSIAERREYELRCAASKLGLTAVHFLNYRDSGMPGSPDNHHPNALAAAPLDEVAAKVVHLIRQIKPQVVLTFDPIGGYRHPDHIAIHLATVRAFQLAGDPTFAPDDLPPYQPQRLYFHTISRRMLRFAVRILPWFGKDPHKWGQNKDIDLASLAAEDFPVHAVIDYHEVLERKTQASECHESQGGPGMARGVMGWVLRMGGNQESFMRAFPAPSNGLKEKDLFQGLDVSF
jgi:LmbE family N-acetylglucosaminyl deacetylase